MGGRELPVGGAEAHDLQGWSRSAGAQARPSPQKARCPGIIPEGGTGASGVRQLSSLRACLTTPRCRDGRPCLEMTRFGHPQRLPLPSPWPWAGSHSPQQRPHSPVSCLGGEFRSFKDDQNLL